MPSGAPDDPSVHDEDILYRRIIIDQVKRRRSDGTIERVGSNAFDDSSDGSPCSVHLHSKLVEAGLDWDSVLAGYETRAGLAWIQVGEARALGYGVVPTPRDGEPGHADLTGDKDTPSRQKQLAKKAIIKVSPPE